MSLSFYVISSHRDFLIMKKSCVREELIDLPFFLQTRPFSSEQKLRKSSYRIIKASRKKKRSEKLKRSDIKYFLTIHFLTETTQNCANFVGLLLIICFSIIFCSYPSRRDRSDRKSVVEVST